jgi:predicted PurR-regulated permease PerM
MGEPIQPSIAVKGTGIMVKEDRGPRFRFRLGTLLFVVAILALLLVVAIQEVQIIVQQVQIREMTRELDGYFGVQAKSIEELRKLQNFSRELQNFSRELQDILDSARSERELQDIADRLRSAADKLHE